MDSYKSLRANVQLRNKMHEFILTVFMIPNISDVKIQYFKRNFFIENESIYYGLVTFE